MSLTQNLYRRLFRRRSDVPVQLLTRPGCHLCDEAEVALRHEFGPENVEAINILEYPELESQYVFRIPVLLYQGEPVAEGQIDRQTARRVRQAIVRQLQKNRENR